MAAKVKSDPRAVYLLPLIVAVGVLPAPPLPLILAAHAGNVYLHASRIPILAARTP